MTIYNNVPTFSYIHATGISVTWNNELYMVQDFSTNKKYVYWNADIPYQLNASNIMPNRSNKQHLVLINDNGIATEVPPTTEDFSISYDGNSVQAIKDRVYGLYAKNEEFGEKFVGIETDIDNLKSIVGESGSLDENFNEVWEKISEIEQKSDEIDLTVKETSKNYNDDKQTNKLREDLNGSIITINSSLGTFKSEINDYFKNQEISDEEKVKIETQIEILETQKAVVDGCVDKVILIAEEGNLGQNVVALDSAKKALQNAHDNLKNNITNAVLDKIITPTENTIIIDAFAKYNLRLNELKSTCDDVILLGLGGVLIEELGKINVKSDEIKLSVSKVESSFKGEMSVQKIELESQIKDVSSALGIFEDTVNTVFKDSVISEAEKSLLNEKIANLDKEKLDIDTRYNSISIDVNLTPSIKEDLTQKYNDYCNTHGALKEKIENVISDDVVNDAEKLEVDSLFKDYTNSLASFSAVVLRAIEDISFNSAKVELNKAKEELKAEIEEVKESVTNVEDYVNSTFEDNILDEVERKNIQQNLEVLSREKIDIDNVYENIYNNSYLDSDSKVSFKNSYDDYIIAYNEVVSVSNGILNKDTLIDNIDKANLESAIAKHKDKLNLFFIEANKAMDIISANESSSLKSDIQQEISDINDRIEDILGDIEDSTTDGIIDQAEAIIIKESLENIEKEKLDVDAKYNVIYSNSLLEESAKENLEIAKTEFDTATSNLIDVVTTIIEDEKVTEDENTSLVNARDEYKSKSAILNTRFEEAIDYISKKQVDIAKEDLKNEIEDLGDVILNLESEMNGAFKDGVLTEAEKTSINQHLLTLSAEKSDIDKQYSTIYSNKHLEGDAKTNLNTSYNNYISAYNSLVSIINGILTKDGLIDSADRTNLNNAFKAHDTKLGEYTTSATNALDSITQKKAEVESEKVDEKYAEIILDPDNGIVSKVGKLETTVTEQGTVITETKSEINQMSDQITVAVSKANNASSTANSAMSQVSILSDEVSTKVSAGDIASSINQTAQSVKINASKINLSGYVTFSELGYELSDYVTDYDLGRYGTTVIHGDRILTDTISVNHLKANNAHPIIKLFQHSGGSGYCSLDATQLNEQGQGNAIRLKWDDNNYVRVADGNISFYMTGSNNNESALCSMYGGSSAFTLNTKGGVFSLNNGVYYNSVKLSQEGHSHSWSAITSKPSTFTPSSHGHSWSEITSKPSTFSPSWHDHYASHLEPANVIPASKNSYYCGNHGSNWWYLVATNWIRYNGIAGGVYSLKGKTVNAIKDFFGNYSAITTYKNNTPISAYNDMIDYIYNEIYEENEEGYVFAEGATLSSYQSQCLEILINENEELKSKNEVLESKLEALVKRIEDLENRLS